MKRIFIVIIAMLLSAPLLLSADDPDALVGEWLTQEGTSVVEIYRCEHSYCGKIVWLKTPLNEEGKDKVDTKNPDEKLRNRKLMDLTILWGFSHKEGNLWDNGKIYDPKNGKTYSCKMNLEGNTLNVRGYIGISLLGRTAVWTRKQG